MSSSGPEIENLSACICPLFPFWKSEWDILSVQRRDLTQGNILQEWFIKKVIPAFSGRILNVDMDIAMRCAELHVPDPRSDRDALIAATALTHKMSVVTRNCKDFEPMGVPIINPWTC